MGFGILIGNQPISEDSKSALIIRSGDLGKSGTGARAKADALRNAKAGKFSFGSTLIPGANAFYFRGNDGNLGYDSRPSMSLTLRLRGPKQ